MKENEMKREYSLGGRIIIFYLIKYYILPLNIVPDGKIFKLVLLFITEIKRFPWVFKIITMLRALLHIKGAL